MHPIVNVFLICLQTIIPQTQGVEITLFQRCLSVVTLKQHWVHVISTPCVCRVFIWRAIPPCLWTPGTLCKRDSLEIHLKIWKKLLKVAPRKKPFINFANININKLQFHSFCLYVPILYTLKKVEDLRFSYVYSGCKRGTPGWNELKHLTCFLPMFPFYTP